MCVSHQDETIRRPAVGCIAWLGVWCGFTFIVFCTSCDSKLSVAVVDVHKTTRSDAKLLCEPPLYHYDEILANDFSDAAGEWSEFIAASREGNLESELPVDEFDWAFQ